MQIFYLNSSTIEEAEEYKAFLSAEELKRLERISFTKAKINFALGRFLIRSSLSKILNCKPSEVILKKTPSGRLELESAVLSFNLSHSNDIVILAVSENKIGIDIELVKPRNFLAVAEYLFNEKEIAILKKSDTFLARNFYSYWTLKEAFVKCNGKQILDRSAQFGGILEGKKIISTWNDEYQLLTFSIEKNYIVSVVLKTLNDENLDPIPVQKITSLTSAQTVHFPILFSSTR